MTWNVR